MYKFTFINEQGGIPENDKRAQFNINEKKRTIACILRVRASGFDSLSSSGFHFLNDLEEYIVKKLKKYGYYCNGDYISACTFTFVGKAYCEPSDKFNVEVGKHIAETRARLQVYEMMELINKIIKQYIKELQHHITLMEERTHFLKFREIDHERTLVRNTVTNEDNSPVG